MKETTTGGEMETLARDYRVVESGDNGEFLTWAMVELLVDGKVVETTEFHGSSEFPGEDALTQALSYGRAFVEVGNDPFGHEWDDAP